MSLYCAKRARELNDLTKGKIMKTFYHKATIAGAINLFDDFETELRLCVSSDNSRSLFWRNVVIVLNVEEKNIIVENDYDIDSRGQSEYDEARLVFETKQDFLNSVKYMIIDGKTKKSINSLKAEIVEAINTQDFFRGDHEEAAQLACKDFFINNNSCPVLNLIEAKKINKKWDRGFLNI